MSTPVCVRACDAANRGLRAVLAADHDGLVTLDANAILTRDQREGETPDTLYSTYRYLDRWLDSGKRERYSDTLASIEIDRLSPRVQYLFWHLLVLTRQARSVLGAFPNLRPLAAQRHVETPLDPPLVLSANPRHSWAYFTRVGIIL